MNIMKRIFTAGVAALALGGMAATTATTTASASTTQAASSRPLPKIKVGVNLDHRSGWYHSTWKVRPSYVYFGVGAGNAAPRIKNLRWSHYNQVSAYARGRWFMNTCRPTCAAGGYWINGGAYFYGVFNHSGPGRNFGNVKITWTQRGRHHSMHMWIDSTGHWNWR